MTTKADFTKEEWARLGRAPLVAGMAISFADPGGPIEAIKESSAAIKTVLEAAEGGGHGEFVQALAADVAEQARQHHNPMAGFKPKGAQAREQLVEELLIEKTSPDETAQFREWLKSAAQRAASAAKEGGFLGFHAQRVSEGEQRMLDTLGEIFDGPAA